MIEHKILGHVAALYQVSSHMNGSIPLEEVEQTTETVSLKP